MNRKSVLVALIGVCSMTFGVGFRTRGKRLLELLNLVGVLEDKGVELLGAPNLELGLVGLLVLLDPGGYSKIEG